MSTYIIFCMQDVTDVDALQRYRELARPTLIQHGPRIHCGPNIVETLEGPALEGALVMEFESKEAARAWYDSPEYQEAAAVRKAGASMMAFIVEGR